MAERPIKKKTSSQAPQREGGGNLLINLLTFPVLGMPRMVAWIATNISEAIEAETLDEAKLQGQLLNLQMRYELGEIDDEEYVQQESIILKKLKDVREANDKI